MLAHMLFFNVVNAGKLQLSPLFWRCMRVGISAAPKAVALLVHHLRDRLPADGEERALYAVRQDPRAEPAAEEPSVALLLDDQLCGLQVADRLQRRLARGLQHPQRVGASVGDGSRGEADHCIPHVLAIGELEGWKDLTELIVGVEPWVVAHPRGSHSAHSALPEGRGVLLRLLDEALQAVLTLHLLRGLPSVNGHEEDAEPGGATGSCHGLHSRGQLRVLQCRERAVVGRGVAEARDGGLDEPRRQAAVEARDAALRVELLDRFDQTSAIAVLVVHDSPHPHESQDVDRLRSHASEAAAERLLRRPGHDD
mmetsp:Transcript_112037/g.361725  ORF Transcript_112037/g.361725 Transcript_112037/m.361725 type:complete len:311 (-) Transcript_112037:118-1050(-)